MRKLALVLALLLLGATALPAQVDTPYKYGKRWNIALFGGPAVFASDYTTLLIDHYQSGELFSLMGGAWLGYNITSGHQIRFMANYSRKSGALPLSYGYYPYSFRTTQVYGDYMLNFNGLGEDYWPFSPQLYVGVGVAGSYDFRTSWLDEERDALLTRLNIVPTFHYGVVLEYDFRNGLGLFLDVSMAYYLDTYNGLGYIDFPLDYEIDAAFGLIYHFKTNKKGIR